MVKKKSPPDQEEGRASVPRFRLTGRPAKPKKDGRATPRAAAQEEPRPEDEAVLRRRQAASTYDDFRGLLGVIVSDSTYGLPEDKRVALVAEILGAFGDFLRWHGNDSSVMAVAKEGTLSAPTLRGENRRAAADGGALGSGEATAGTIPRWPPTNLAYPSIRDEMLRRAMLERSGRVLPGTAPELYTDRPADPHTGARETAVQFLERVWRDPWIAAGILTRAELRKRDPQLMKALERWMDAGNVLPRQLQLPTKQEQVTHQLETADPVQLRETLRLLRAQERRRQRAGD